MGYVRGGMSYAAIKLNKKLKECLVHGTTYIFVAFTKPCSQLQGVSLDAITSFLFLFWDLKLAMA